MCTTRSDGPQAVASDTELTSTTRLYRPRLSPKKKKTPLTRSMPKKGICTTNKKYIAIEGCSKANSGDLRHTPTGSRLVLFYHLPNGAARPRAQADPEVHQRSNEVVRRGRRSSVVGVAALRGEVTTAKGQ